MKNYLTIGVAGLALLACTPQPQQPAEEATVVTESIPATSSTTQTASSATPTTVRGGSGNTCLAVDVLANDMAFIRKGTAGTLVGNVFTVDGVPHDLSGTPYSTRSC